MSSESKTKLQGRVIQAADGKGVSGVEVGVWLKAPGVQDLLGTAKTDKDGAFAVSVDGARLAQLATQSPSSLFFGISRKDEGLACFERVLATAVEGRGVVLTLPDVAPAKGSSSDGDGKKGKSKSRSKQRDEAPAKRGAASKAAPPCRDEDDEDDDDEDDDDDDHSNPPDPDKDTFVVRGQVRDVDGKPLAGAIVRAVDRDLRSEEPLGEAQTCLCGFYRIQYEAEQFKRLEKKRADLVIKVFRETAEPAVQSPIQFNAAAEAIVDLMIGGGVYRGPSEYEALVDGVAPLLDGVAVAELTDDDLSFLSGETERALALLQHLRAATQLALTTALAPEVHYAFLRRDLPAKLDELLRVEKATYERAIVEALEQNLIPSRLKTTLPAVLARLEELRAQSALTTTPAPEVTPVADVVGTSLPTIEQQQRFMELYTSNQGDLPQFWQNLRTDPELGPLVEPLQKSLQIGLLVQNHVPMITHLQAALAAGQLPGLDVPCQRFEDLARLDREDWLTVMQQQVDGRPIGVPAGARGTTPAEKAASYAEALVGTIEAAFPTAVAAHQIARDQPPGAPDLTAFFARNSSFDVKTTTISTYLADHPSALDGLQDPDGTLARVEALQRLLRLTGRYETARLLLDEGLDSARAISRLREAHFVERYADAMGGAMVASKVYRRARQTASAAVSLFSQFGIALESALPATVPGLPRASTLPLARAAGIAGETRSLAATVESRVTATARLPDWKALFGDYSLCSCSECRSVLSPAAYLVDILNLMKFRQAIPEEGGAERRVLDVLTTRRPDIVEIELSCANTNTPVPYIDLVNELLEDGVILVHHYEVEDPTPLPSPGQNARQRQTRWSAAELAAHPEYLNPAAYAVVQAARHPWTLPFDLWWEESRLYLGHLGSSRAALMELFQRTILADDESAEEPTELEIACEYLGLTSFECELVTTAGGVAEAYGQYSLDFEALAQVSFLLELTELTYDELEEMLGLDFVRERAGVELAIEALDPNDPCNLEKLALVGLSPANGEAVLDGLHRFVRLRRKMGWTARQMQRALTLLGYHDIDAGFLIELAATERLARDLGLATDEVLDFLEPGTNARSTVLMRTLGATAADLATLAALTGVDPRVVPQPVELEAWLARARRLLHGRLSLPELAYLYLHRSEPGVELAPRRDGVLALLESVRQDLARIADETSPPAMPSREDFTRSLERLLDPARAKAARDFLESFPIDTSENRARVQLHFPFLPPEPSYAALLPAVAPTGDAERATYLRGAFTFVLAGALARVRQTLGERAVIQRAADTLGLEPATADLLLTSVLHAHADPAAPAVSDFRALHGDGVHVRYAALDPNVPAVTRVEPAVDFDWGAAPPDPSLPSTTFTAELTARLWAPSADAYTFFVRASGGVRLEVAGQVVLDDLDGTTPRELVSPPVLAGGLDRPLDLKLTFRANGGSPSFLRLEWSRPSGARAIIPRGAFFSSPLDLGHALRTYERLHKAARVVKALGASARELRYLDAHAGDFGGFDVDGLPLVEASAAAPGQIAAWELVEDVFVARDRLPAGERGLFDLFERASSGAPWDEVVTLLADITGFSTAEVSTLAGDSGFGLDVADFRNATWLRRLVNAVELSHQLQTAVSLLQRVALSTPDAELTGEIREALRAKHGEAEWLAIEKGLRDPLRERQRASLVAYLLPRASYMPGADWMDVNELFQHYLVDVEMSPCQLTSRVKLAIGTVQLFMQRCLMNLEPSVELDDEDAAQWRNWMHSYRVWEANRKVFLYPENWIRSELRKDKTPFFAELEQELQQREVTDAAAEEALASYVSKLDGVARLQVAGTFHEFSEEVDVLHVFARTQGTPREHWYRRRVDSSIWTPWEKVELDIEADDLIPIIHQRRLYLFWPVFEEKAQDAAVPIQSEGGRKPDVVKEIRMAWSVYRDGRWQPKKVSTSSLVNRRQGLELSRNAPDYAFTVGYDSVGDVVIECHAREVRR